MTDETRTPDKLTLVTELAKRRGFYWQSYEIYGGTSGFYTYGPLGAKLKQNIENKLRQTFAQKLGLQEIESPTITPAAIFEASGHLKHFKEPMIECKKCNKKFRADHLLREQTHITDAEAEKLTLEQLQQQIQQNNVKCPECGAQQFGEPKQFFTMFTTTIGPYSDNIGYGRPEAAQGIFVEFNRLYTINREKLPFGTLQIGHALRNEISPRQGLLRQREFTIADLEFFYDPEQPDCHILKEIENETLQLLLAKTRQKNSEKLTKVTVKEALKKGHIKTEWMAAFMTLAKHLLIQLGIPAENQRFIEKLPWERAHYSSETFDQEVILDRWGWTEASGHANRGDYDLKKHMEATGTDMTVFKEYEKPTEKECITIKPNMAKLGPAFKKEAAKVTELLAKTDPQQVETQLQKNGHYMLNNYKILPEHVSINREKTIETGRRFIPHVVEPSFGTDRLFHITLEYAYTTKEDRVILKFPRDIAPIQIGIYPLMPKDKLDQKAQEIQKTLTDAGFTVEYDEAGSIGRRYARADEIGIPLGITIDYDTLKNNTVTIRDRDTWKQVRTKTKNLPELLHRYFRYKANFEDLGQAIQA
jgi:glycyl-tRNA synthetase